MPSPCTVGYCMPTALYAINATVGLHVTVPRMPVLKRYGSLTEYFQCTVGIRQGCMLSPFLFAQYIDVYVCRRYCLWYGHCVSNAENINMLAKYCKKWGLLRNASVYISPARRLTLQHHPLLSVTQIVTDPCK